MYGYIFEVKNKKTGATYLGKRYAVSFDKNYFGEENNHALAVAIETYGRPSFETKMIMPYENQVVLDTVFDEMVKSAKKKSAPKKEEPVEEEVAVAPKKRSKKTVEE